MVRTGVLEQERKEMVWTDRAQSRPNTLASIATKTKFKTMITSHVSHIDIAVAMAIVAVWLLGMWVGSKIK